MAGFFIGWNMQLFINGAAQATLSDYDTEPLVRSVIISLFSWKRAGDDDELPGKSKEGWWGDSYSDDQIGSKLWLLSRAKLTSETLKRAQSYAKEALQWLIDDQVAESVDVTAERGGRDRLDLGVVITKPDQSKLNMRFQNVWDK